MAVAVPTPTVVLQLESNGLYRHEDCGESCACSALHDAGKVETVAVLENWDANHGDNPIDGTLVATVALSIAAYGVPTKVGSNLADAITALDAGHRCVALVGVNSYGVVGDGSLGHFVEAYAYNGVAWLIMNPLGGLQTISDSVMRSAYQGSFIDVQYDYGGIDVPSQAEWDHFKNDVYGMVARLAYYIEGNFEFPNVATRDAWAADVPNKGLETYVFTARDSGPGRAEYNLTHGTKTLLADLQARVAKLEGK